MTELSWKRECLSLWSFGIHRHTKNVKFTSFLHETIPSPPFFYKLQWFYFEKKITKTENYLIAESLHLASEFLTLYLKPWISRTIFKIWKISFGHFALVFFSENVETFWLALFLPGVMWFSDISTDIFSFDMWYCPAGERREDGWACDQDMTAKLKTKWHLQQVFCGIRVRKSFFLYF